MRRSLYTLCIYLTNAMNKDFTALGGISFVQFRLRNPSMRLAFAVMVSICLFQDRSDDISTPSPVGMRCISVRCYICDRSDQR